VLVTWGSYALGIFDAGNLVEWKTGTGYIHKKHRKGGRSQKRFARRTEEQKKDFLRRAGNRIDERLGSFAPDYIFFGGNRLILKPLIQECKYLQTKAGKISSRVLDVRYADREALVNSLAEITKSLVFTF
jgi:peptide subunit release factor 1 (eRF1)